jgi:O-antigen ligase
MNRFLDWIRAPALPPAEPLPRWLDQCLTVALALLGFFLVWTPAGVSISLAALLFLALVAARAIWRSAPWRDPVIAVGLALLVYIAIHTFWFSGFTGTAGKAINGYHELLMAAILLALFRLVSRPNMFYNAMVLGAIGYAATHWLALFIPTLAADLTSRRISAGLSLAVVAFVLVERARLNPRPWPARFVAAFLSATVLFAIDGRTGHLVLLVLVSLVAWIHSSNRWRWAALAAAPLAVLAISLGSSAVQQRIAETLAGSTKDTNGELSSTGIRIELIRNGLALSSQHYAVGSGFARYAEANQKSITERLGPEPVRQGLPWAVVNNPHNEFLMQLVGGGIVALGLFVVWLVLPVMRQHNGHVSFALIGLVLAFSVGCAFNSMLRDFVEGHLYVALLVWLLAVPPLQASSAQKN